MNTQCKLTSTGVSSVDKCGNWNMLLEKLDKPAFNLAVDKAREYKNPAKIAVSVLKEGDESSSMQEILDKIITAGNTAIEQQSSENAIASWISYLDKRIHILITEDKQEIAKFLMQSKPIYHFESDPQSGEAFLSLSNRLNVDNLARLANALVSYTDKAYDDLMELHKAAIETCEKGKPGQVVKFFKQLFVSTGGEALCTSIPETLAQGMIKIMHDRVAIDNFVKMITQVSRLDESLKITKDVPNALAKLGLVLTAIGNTTLSEAQKEQIAQRKMILTEQTEFDSLNRAYDEEIFKRDRNTAITASDTITAQAGLEEKKKKFAKVKRERLVEDQKVALMANPFVVKTVAIGSLGVEAAGVVVTSITPESPLGWAVAIGLAGAGIFIGKQILSSHPLVRAGEFASWAVSIPPWAVRGIASWLMGGITGVGNKSVTIFKGSLKMGQEFTQKMNELKTYNVFIDKSVNTGILYVLAEKLLNEMLLGENKIVVPLYYKIGVYGSILLVQLVANDKRSFFLKIDIVKKRLQMCMGKLDKTTMFDLVEQQWRQVGGVRNYDVTRCTDNRYVFPTKIPIDKTYIVQIGKSTDGILVSPKINHIYLIDNEDDYNKLVVKSHDEHNGDIYVVDGLVADFIAPGLTEDQICEDVNQDRWYATRNYFVNLNKKLLIARIRGENFMGLSRGGKNNIGKKTRRRKYLKSKNKTKKIYKKRNLKTKNNKRNKRNKTKAKARNKDKK
jgi:hypothetical protein